MGNAAAILHGCDILTAKMHTTFWWFASFCFLLGRLFHSIFFAQEMQLQRTIAFAVGLFGTVLHLIMAFVFVTSASFS